MIAGGKIGVRHEIHLRFTEKVKFDSRGQYKSIGLEPIRDCGRM